ncbi:MAG: hypothetical protein GX905_09415, partial [Bacteroidales bacterium]|nr:hypothetical protein [Bacteroidales bacterium]
MEELVEIYKDDLTDYTEKYYQVLVSSETIWIEEDFMGLGLVKLGILVGDPDAPRRVAMIRQTGMKIMDKDHLPGHVPCVGIMFIEGDKLNEKLRVMENPEHTQWQPERTKNPVAARELVKSLNRFIKEQIEKLISTGGGEEIDAVGVGTFLPDEPDESNNHTVEEVVSDKVVEVEKKVAQKKTVSGDVPGDVPLDSSSSEDGGQKLPGGSDEEWFHSDGTTNEKQPKDGQPAHIEEGGKEKKASKEMVSLKRFVPVCVDKEKGQYVLLIVPRTSGTDGVLEVYLSAETQNYEAFVKSASVISGGPISVKGNVIEGINFVKD